MVSRPPLPLVPQKAALRPGVLRGAACPDVLKGSGARVGLPVAHYSDTSRSHLRMLATIYASRLLQLHIIPFTLPISLDSLDRKGVRLLSPRDSQILPKPVCRCRCYRAGDATKLKEEFDEDLVLCIVLF